MAADLAAARQNMVESQVRTADVTNLNISDAMRIVPRESLLPAARVHAAYADTEVEYAPGLYLMRPRDISKLLQVLGPRPGERALCIAAPYAAQLLEKMDLQVTRHEDEDLTAVSGGPYDVIVSEGAVSVVPDSWKSVLALHGRLGIVERAGPVGRVVVYVRSEDGVGGRSVFESSAPFLPGFAPKAAFAF